MTRISRWIFLTFAVCALARPPAGLAQTTGHAELPRAAVAQTPPKPRPPANSGLVIVTPRQFDAALEPLVEYRRRRLPVEVAILETVLAKSPGGDDPEKLKQFLYAAWQKRKARYVLLVGDATVLPVRYMVLDRVTPAAFDTAFYPSDP